MPPLQLNWDDPALVDVFCALGVMLSNVGAGRAQHRVEPGKPMRWAEKRNAGTVIFFYDVHEAANRRVRAVQLRGITVDGKRFVQSAGP